MTDAADVLLAASARAAALADGDADRLLLLLHPEFRWTTHVGTTYDREEYVRRNTAGDTGGRRRLDVPGRARRPAARVSLAHVVAG